ncbi:MAG TPA: response regulator [Anaeromyxobacter sp.]|nr:response regulator [Anaeromyxobacter sp.]
MRALVVDDSLPARRHAGRMLASLGFEVFEAGDGAEALKAMASLGPVELVLLDWNMPYVDGLWFLRSLRKEPAYRDVLVVMATGNTDMASVQQALAEGANEYLMKPFSDALLFEKLTILGFQFATAGTP